MSFLERLARYVLRRELRDIATERERWKAYALAQQRWRREVLGESPADFETGFSRWYLDNEKPPP